MAIARYGDLNIPNPTFSPILAFVYVEALNAVRLVHLSSLAGVSDKAVSSAHKRGLKSALDMLVENPRGPR